MEKTKKFFYYDTITFLKPLYLRPSEKTILGPLENAGTQAVLWYLEAKQAIENGNLEKAESLIRLAINVFDLEHMSLQRIDFMTLLTDVLEVLSRESGGFHALGHTPGRGYRVAQRSSLAWQLISKPWKGSWTRSSNSSLVDLRVRSKRDLQKTMDLKSRVPLKKLFLLG